LSSRVRTDPIYPRINFAEYVFLRRASVAWFSCASNTGFLSRNEIKRCAFSVLNFIIEVYDSLLRLYCIRC